MISDNMKFVGVWTESSSVEEAARLLGQPVRTVVEHARYLKREGVLLQEFLNGPSVFES